MGALFTCKTQQLAESSLTSLKRERSQTCWVERSSPSTLNSVRLRRNLFIPPPQPSTPKPRDSSSSFSQLRHNKTTEAGESSWRVPPGRVTKHPSGRFYAQDLGPPFLMRGHLLAPRSAARAAPLPCAGSGPASASRQMALQTLQPRVQRRGGKEE